MPPSKYEYPVVIDNPPRSLYRDAEGANYSLLKLFARSPFHVRDEMANRGKPRELSSSIIKGLAIEQLALLGDLDSEQMVLSPHADFRSKEARDWRDFHQAAGRVIVTQEILKDASCAAEAVHQHPVAGPLIKECRVQVMASDVYAFENGTKVTRKCLIDGVGTASNVLVDLKSTTDASPNAWRRRAAQLFYHVQSTYYTDIWSSASRSESDEVPTFVFVCVESEPPYGVGCYVLDSEARATGQALWQSWLQRWHECMTTGKWPGYTDEAPGYISLPKYALGDLPI